MFKLKRKHHLQWWCTLWWEFAVKNENVSFGRIVQLQWLSKVRIVYLWTRVKVFRWVDMSTFIFIRIPTINDVQSFNIRWVFLVQNINHLNRFILVRFMLCKEMDVRTVSGLMHAKSGCLRLLHLGRRYDRERSPIKSRFVPSSTDTLTCSSLGSVKLRIN